MIIRYYYNFSVGTSMHCVEVYDSYTDEFGLGNRIERREHPRMREVAKGLDMTPAQRRVLNACMRERSDEIAILEDGRLGR